MTAEAFSDEQRILRVMRQVLASVVKDVTPQEGMDNPLTERTIQDIRDIFGLISAREKELLEELGQFAGDRPYYPGDTPPARVIPISVAGLAGSRKKAESTNPLASMPLFRDADLEEVEKVLDECSVYELEAGDTLLSAGENNNDLYLVLAGRLVAELGSEDAPRAMAFEAGQTLGEISALGESTMAAAVVAETKTLVLKIDHNRLWRMIDADAAIGRNVLRILAQR